MKPSDLSRGQGQGLHTGGSVESPRNSSCTTAIHTRTFQLLLIRKVRSCLPTPRSPTLCAVWFRNFELFITEEDIGLWKALLRGPEHSVYEVRVGNRKGLL